MADTPTSTTTTTAPAATTTEATDVTGAAPPPAPGLAAIKAARRAAAVPTPPATPNKEPTSDNTAAAAVPAPPPEKATATIEMDEGALKQFSTLSRELRDAKKKASDLEAKIAGFSKFEKASALAKDGKHYDAAREAGIDVDAALAELLQNNPGTVTATQIDKEMAKRLEALEAKDLEREKQREEGKKQASAASIEEDRKVTSKFVVDNAAKYPYLAKSPRLVGMAFGEYQGVKATLEAEKGGELSGDENVRLMLATLATFEADSAKEFGPAATTESSEPTTGIDGGARAGVREPATKEPRKVTFAELKAERMAKRSAQRAS